MLSTQGNRLKFDAVFKLISTSTEFVTKVLNEKVLTSPTANSNLQFVFDKIAHIIIELGVKTNSNLQLVNYQSSPKEY